MSFAKNLIKRLTSSPKLKGALLGSISVLVILLFVIVDLVNPVGSQVLGTRTSVNFGQLLKRNLKEVVPITPVKIPEKVGNEALPQISAEAAIAIDRQTYTPLFSKHPKTRTFPASTTKIATAIIVMREYDLNKIVTVPADIYKKAPGSSMHLIPQDKLTIKDLLIGMLVNSGNDAAYTLALAHPKGIDGFMSDMNNLAIELNLKDTSFSNPVGFDSTKQYTSPLNLAVLADNALKFPLIQQIVATKDITVRSAIDPDIKYPLHNTNRLLGTVAGVRGVKTGWTDAAQGVLVTDVVRNGHEIIVVVMRSTQREYDSTKIIEWVYKNYSWN